MVCPQDIGQRASLAYRKAQKAIWAGLAPDKYTRILPFVRGDRVLELGSAEGVLSLLLAERLHRVIGLEMRADRHREAIRLQDHWLKKGRDVSSCHMMLGDIRDHMELLKEVDTLIAVRSIYYLREDAAKVMNAVYLAGVSQVILCGNRNREAQSKAEPGTELGRFNRLASVSGMTELLEEAGFRIDQVVIKGDPIVIGERSTRE